MRSAKSNFFFSAVLLAGVLCAFPAYAAEGEPSENQFKADLNDIKARLQAIEVQQKEILAKEDKILEECDRIRIWVHKR